MNARTITAILAVMAILLMFSVLRGTADLAEGPETVSYTAFKALVRDGRVTAVTMRGDSLRAEVAGPDGTTSRQVESHLPPTGDPDLLPALESHGAEVTALADSGGSWWLGLLPWLLLIGIYAFFWTRMSRQMPGAGGRMDRFLKGRAGQEEKSARRVTFDDVAGQDNAKAEVAELVDFLRQPERYRAIGAEAPRGILLMGPPGTGKTLLARALAGEAGVPFFNISASEFIEMYVGVGASRVRAMFDEAKKRAPSILFIDELDAVGRVRGAGVGGGHDEREQTLNQILSEMDGFAGHEAVVVLAATNRPDVLDPALLRPGRFDRQVVVPNPDVKGREQIIKVHMRKVPTAPDVDAKVLARGTPGFSGADLANLVNEAALLAARNNKRVVTMAEFEAAKDKVLMGAERRSMVMSEEERERTAYHEAGHALVGLFSPKHDPLHKVTIIPRGRALGVTMSLPERDQLGFTRLQLESRIAMAYGGRVAEELIFGQDEVSNGAAQDISMATKMARKMVTEWGMSDKLGPLQYSDNEEEVFLGHAVTQRKNVSDATAHVIDEEIRRLVTEGEQRARHILDEHLDGLHTVAKALLEYETLSGEEVKALLRGEKIYRPEEPVDINSDTQSRGQRSAVPPTARGRRNDPPAEGAGGPTPEPQPGT